MSLIIIEGHEEYYIPILPSIPIILPYYFPLIRIVPIKWKRIKYNDDVYYIIPLYLTNN